MARPTEPVLERFYRYCKPGGKRKCWLWGGALDPDGYGIFWMNLKKVRAHRAAFALFNGKLIPGKVVMHSCDTPACVNPRHLIQGTGLDNTHDMFIKGRAHPQHGTYNPNSKLSWDIVATIRQSAGLGIKQRVIAKKYQVSESTISQVVNNTIWRDAHADTA